MFYIYTILIVVTCMVCVLCSKERVICEFCKHVQARRQGGFEGFARTPFWPPKDSIYTAMVHFKCPTGSLVSLLLRITAVQGSLVAATRVCS